MKKAAPSNPQEAYLKDDIDQDKGIDPRLPKWITMILGNRVVIQCRGGVIITGTVESSLDGLLRVRLYRAACCASFALCSSDTSQLAAQQFHYGKSSSVAITIW